MVMIKKEYLDSIVSYDYCGMQFSVKLSEANAAQLKILKGIVPEYFEKEKTSPEK
jgi:hypothetical protein